MASTVDICLITILLLAQFKSIISANNQFNLTLDDIPMFLTITFDGVVDEDSYDHIDKLLQHSNRNDEQIPLVFFVNNDIEYMKNYSDYSVIQELYLQGCEIGIHTDTPSLLYTNINKWYYEINRSRELISHHADIPIENLVGFRTLLFENEKCDISDQVIQVLNGLNPPFLYDSSIIDNKLNTKEINWPYKLDNYSMYEQDLWEMSVYDLDAITNHSFKDEISYIFLQRYNSNRSPINLRFNLTWLEQDQHVDVLNDFIEWVLKQDNTWIVTNKQLIEWMNSPIPNTEYTIENEIDYNMSVPLPTNFTFCEYLDPEFEIEGVFDTAQDECPESWPYKNQWNLDELVYTQINISTTKHNINEDYIFCKHTINDYEIYDSDEEYCSTATDLDLIQYNDTLYECKWWTKKGELPDESSAWQVVKDCSSSSVNEEFVRGNIVPYGIVNVFIQNELHINIHAYNGYDMDEISVIIDDVVYNLTIFDDYKLNLTNDYELILRFDEIILPKYEIQISFKSASYMVKTSFITALSIYHLLFIV